jgi:6-phosphogluconolactonase
MGMNGIFKNMLTMIKHNYTSKIGLEKDLGSTIVQILTRAIKKRGSASIIFSGGSTPKGLMNELAKSTLDWEKIKIGLVDDRMVEESSEFSNLALLKKELVDLIDGDKKPTICSLVFSPKKKKDNFNEAIESVLLLGSIDIALLGMGTDGHFASLFPQDATSLSALEDSYALPLVYTTAPTAPQERISFSWPYLKSAEHIFLHITGRTKKKIIASYRDPSMALPIDHFLGDVAPSTAIYWAP